MKNDKGITLIKVIAIVIALIVLMFLVVLGINIYDLSSSGIMEPAKPQYNYNQTNKGNSIDTDKSSEITINGKTYANEADYMNGIEKAEKTIELDINSELVQELHSKILKFNHIYDFGSGKEYSFYRDKKVTVSDLTNTEKVIAVMQYLEENNYGTKIKFTELEQKTLDKLTMYVSPDEEPGFSMFADEICYIYDAIDLEKGAKLIFGDNVQIEWFSFDNCCGETFDYIDGKYYNYCYPGGGYGYYTYGFSKIEEARQDENYIYIYDTFIYAEDVLELTDMYTIFYINSTKSLKIGEDQLVGVFIPFELDDTIELISKYEDKLNTYKHTFRKNADGEYYWISTEIEN